MDLMNRVFKHYLDKFVVVFIAYIQVYSKSKEEHSEHFQIVLNTLKEPKLYDKFKKCEFWLEKVHFSRHVISKEGVFVDPAKVEVVVDWPRPTNIIQVRSFLGMTGYYRRFVEGFSKFALPLTQLLCKNNKFEWIKDCEPSFRGLNNGW